MITHNHTIVYISCAYNSKIKLRFNELYNKSGSICSVNIKSNWYNKILVECCSKQ